MVVKHVSEPPPRIGEVVSDLPKKLARILERLLEKKPADRFADYDELLEALEDARPRVQPEAGFLVRAIAWGVDVGLVAATAALHDYAPLVVYPIYFIGAWALDRGTIGQWLFRLRVQNDDDSTLSVFDSVKRFVVMHWGAAAFMGIAAIMWFGFGIESVHFKGTDLTTPGNPVIQILFAGLMTATLIIWTIGALITAVHPRKRALHDILSGTKVTYKLDAD